MIPDALLALIRKFEGLRLKPYLCPAGVPPTWVVSAAARQPGTGRASSPRPSNGLRVGSFAPPSFHGFK